MKPFNKILIATDGSESAKEAAIQGLALAKLLDAEVTAMSIEEADPVHANRGLTGLTRATVYFYLEDAKAAVEEVCQEGERMGVVMKTMTKKGVPANEIIEASKDFDLVVMGTLGRTGLSHLLIGSVAEKVVRFASCPVLVIRARGAPRERVT